MINVGVIGYGYWGPNLVRNVAEAAGATLLSVSDLRKERLAVVHSRYPGVATTTDHREIVNDPKIDAVIIATPVGTHYELAHQALAAGKHVLIEKPLTTSAEQAQRLIELADRQQRLLMVDHTYVYSGAVRKIQELIAQKAIGDVYYFDSVRVNLGLFQHDVNVIWDLAVHDLSIMDFVLAERPCAVSATGISNVPGQPENIAYINLFFESNLIAHLHVNWLAPVKVRRTLIGGSEKMIVYDELEPSEKVKIYDSGITVSNRMDNSPEQVYQMLISYRAGDMWAPQLDRTEALRSEIMHFIDCVDSGRPSASSGQAGLRIVRILEAAAQSLAQQGRRIDLPGELGSS
jgi:predicted dehydrogenase